jgi:hypothetical protein
MTKRIVRSVIFGLVVVLVAVSPVLAIPDPATPPQINAVYVYNDLLETGDTGILIDYFLDYDPAPGIPPPPDNETAGESFLAIFIDTDGVTQLRAVAPYVYIQSGYERGLMWIYFSADDTTTYSITSANSALYRIWLMGNPTLTWAGAPPKTVGTIDYWQPAGTSTPFLVALRVLALADSLELETSWGTPALDLIQATALGNKLTATGEEYFVNVIPQLRMIAPLAFSSSEENVVPEDIDYNTEFGAIMTDGTGTVTGSPIDLVEGVNSVDVTVIGTFTIELLKGTIGTVEDDTGAVTGSPVDLVFGTNTIIVPAGGTGLLTVTVNLNNAVTEAESGVVGGIFDLTAVAAYFGMSRWMMSGMVWLAISIILCAGVYKIDSDRESSYGGSGGSAKVVMLAFDVMLLLGMFLGMIHPIIGVLLFLGFSALIGYVFFFRQANV